MRSQRLACRTNGQALALDAGEFDDAPPPPSEVLLRNEQSTGTTVSSDEVERDCGNDSSSGYAVAVVSAFLLTLSVTVEPFIVIVIPVLNATY